MAEIKITKADFKIAPYNGDTKADVLKAESIGLLDGKLDIDAKPNVIEIKPLNYEAKKHVRTEYEEGKITTTALEIDDENIVRMGIFKNIGTTEDPEYVLDANNGYVIAIEEKYYDENGKKKHLVFGPCYFTGPFKVSIDGKQTSLPLEYTVYADDATGKLGFYKKTIVKQA